MRTLAVLAFFIAVPLASGTFQPTRDVDFWRTTGFDLPQAQRFFSNSICYTNEDLFNACREGFLQAGSSLRSREFGFLKDVTLEGGPHIDFDALLKRVDLLAAAHGGSEMVYGAMVNALLRQFDAHAVLLPASQVQAFNANSSQEVVGIGAEEEVNEAGLYIRRIYPHSPAEEAGLQVNDRVVRIQGETVKPGLKALRAMRALAQPTGSAIELVVKRDGKTQPPLNVALARFDLQDVSMNIFPQGIGSKSFTAVVRIRSFGHGVCNKLTEQLDAAIPHGVKNLVLDLRFNMGGALDEAACVMSLLTKDPSFVEKRAMKSELPPELGLQLTFGESDMDNWRKGLRPTRWPELPLVVVVNSSTASAAEMLAAALQDAGRAWVIGEITFGKGSTQGLVAGQSFNPELRLLYTVSRYYRPSGAPIQLHGMTPDFVVPFERGATLQERIFPREGELFGTHLMPESAPAWVQPRPVPFAKVSHCVDKRGANFPAEDFQMATALSVLHCAN